MFECDWMDVWICLLKINLFVYEVKDLNSLRTRMDLIEDSNKSIFSSMSKIVTKIFKKIIF